MYGRIFFWGGGAKECGICENEGCAKLIPRYEDMRKHMFYHCGDNDEDHLIVTITRGINRGAMYGFGLQSDDILTSQGNVTVGKIRKVGYASCSISKEGNMRGVGSAAMFLPIGV